MKKDKKQKNKKTEKPASAAVTKPVVGAVGGGYSFKLLVAVVAKGDADLILDSLREFGVDFNFICRGDGTANSGLLNFLGLDSDKDIVLSVVRTQIAGDIVKRLYDVYRAPGVAFTVRLKSLGGARTLKLFQGQN